ncbi:hypothetical protein HOY80DRAFT_1098123 [Tuber brumale]|nr:hypothetical protein HOY80DRAFT_1098123 [Tuber brumale]
MPIYDLSLHRQTPSSKQLCRRQLQYPPTISMDLTFAILSAADICLRTGQNLYERYKKTRGVNRDLDRLNIRVENVWRDIASRLATVQSSLDAVPDNLRVRMEQLLHRLLCFLHTAYKNLENTVDKNYRAVTKPIKFALFQKYLLERDISALEKWRERLTSTFPMLPILQTPEPGSSQYPPE